MSFSNKSLIILAVGVLALSIFGTALSLNMLDSLPSRGVSNTGYLTQDTGDVNLSINNTVSIVMNVSQLDFGTCNLPAGNALRTFNSSLTSADGNLSECDGTASFPNNLTVKNDGNVNANVNLSVSDIPENIYSDATGALLHYNSFNTTTHGGCNSTNVAGWTQITSNANSYNVCRNLTYTGGVLTQVGVNFAITLPGGASNGAGSASMEVVFSAEEST